MANMNVLPDWDALAFLSAMTYADGKIFAAGAIFAVGPELTADSYTVTDPDGTTVQFSGDGFFYDAPQPSPHFFSCDSKAVGLDAKSPRHLQREAGPTDRVIPRVT